MKYWNKRKDKRKNWTSVEGPAYFRRDTVKVWCQNHPSKSRFYFGNPIWEPEQASSPFGLAVVSWPWYFENSEDALAFSLTWGGKVR
jgi:hypothetical protein